MNFDYNQFNYLKRSINWWKVSSIISLVVGIILLIVSIFVKWPAFLVTGIISLICFLYYFGYKLYDKKKNSILKYAKVKKIKGDKEHFICECIYCRQRIRVKNIKGIHGLNCPKCRTHFDVKI